MSKNKLIIAAAGSGKTRTLVEKALKIVNENVLITTFTEANEASIKNKIIQKTGGYIPQNITVQTWFSFLLQHGVRPYQGVMNEYLWDKKIGFYLRSGSSSVYKGKSGKIYSISEEKQFFQYYFISKTNLKIHSDKVSKFVFRSNQKTNEDLIERISKIFPNIFIDEIQDLAGYDLDLLKLFFKSKSNILLVGDPRQGTYSTHSAIKNKKFKKSQIVHFFENNTLKKDLDIDDTSLVINYRSNQIICDLSNKLFPDHKNTSSGIEKTTIHDGVFLIKKININSYLKKYPDCMQLRWDVRKKVNNQYSAINFGESKGLDFNRVLIYPTEPMKKWLKNNSEKLPLTSCSKLYVAITRAKYSVSFVYDYDETTFIKGAKKYEI